MLHLLHGVPRCTLTDTCTLWTHTPMAPPFPTEPQAGLLLDGRHCKIALREGQRLVWVYRTSAPFESTEQCEAGWSEAVKVLDGLERATFRVLVDLRDGPMRSDEAFEKIGQRYRRGLTDGFERAALLVRTVAGRLQLTRHQKEQQFSVSIFEHEDAALAHLRE